LFSLKNSNLTAAATTTADDDEESSETRPVVAPNHDSISLTRANRSSNVNCNAVDSNKAILYADPWIRRCDQPISLDYIRTENQRQKSIQYETRLYYHAVPSTTSSERLSQQQQQCQSLLNSIDKDIEYVESRLRGQTVVSLPSSHSNNYSHDVNWRRHTPEQNFIQNIRSTANEHKYLSNQINDTASSTTTTTTTPVPQKLSPQKSAATLSANGSVKTVKSRLEKMKDQKAAKTLRFIHSSFFFFLSCISSSFIRFFFFPVLFSLLLLSHGFLTIQISSYQLSNLIYFNMVFQCIGNVLVICYVTLIRQ